MGDIVHNVSTWILPVLFAITLHEAAHGYVAHMLGDDTAKRMGRLSLNPVRHIDPFGTVLLPLLLFAMRSPFLFGYAKPVPVNAMRLSNPRRGMMWVALAGPGINLTLALLSGALLHVAVLLPAAAQDWAILNLIHSIQINLLLALFNMLPIPPLDGGRVAVGLLPLSLARPLARIEPYGMFILIGLIFVFPMLGSLFGQNWNIFVWFILPPMEFLYSLIMTHVVGVPA
ncbi:MAG: site-2 protease family protein [Alphaproteobacteria bacterium]|nr:MAG: site-2 protease family protein [Alphaproteobacteria bacterium]